ncbi:MAG: ATPase, T2SS/T4P/T4SS family [Aggregatilineales bacterium]
MPKLVPSRLGSRYVSFQALLESIEKAFDEEYAGTAALAEAATQTERLRLLNETVNYVLAVESIQLETADERATLVQEAYSRLFGYGPLDALLSDTRVTTITLDGPDKAAVRYGHGDLTSIGPLFDSTANMRRILRRMLVDAGTDLYDDQLVVETGLVAAGRRICLNLIAPPLTPSYTADIRVHPALPPSLSDLTAAGFLTPEAETLLARLVRSSYGFAIVGDTESGKTTLLNALAWLLPEPARTIAVERAGEMALPEGIARLTARWRNGPEPAVTFGEQIGVALSKPAACILLDEVRADEPESIAPLLARPDVPRQIWSFRGPFDSKRLRSALSMLARRSDMSQSEAQVQALFRQLPFVITVWRSKGAVSLYSVGEWQFAQSFAQSHDYPDYVPLLQMQDGALVSTGAQPTLSLT